MAKKVVTKKAAKKAAPKKKVSTRATAAPAPAPEPIPAPTPTSHVVSVEPVQETFRTMPATEALRTIPEGEVLVLINGTNQGAKAHNNMTMGEYARKLAQGAGIRTFSVYVDDQKANTTQAGLSMNQFGKIEIVAKDSRGGR